MHWFSRFRCPRCGKVKRLLGSSRRAHPPLCWHEDTARSEWGPTTMELES